MATMVGNESSIPIREIWFHDVNRCSQSGYIRVCKELKLYGVVACSRS
jgi:hypothetical protein